MITFFGSPDSSNGDESANAKLQASYDRIFTDTNAGIISLSDAFTKLKVVHDYAKVMGIILFCSGDIPVDFLPVDETIAEEVVAIDPVPAVQQECDQAYLSTLDGATSFSDAMRSFEDIRSRAAAYVAGILPTVQ